MHPSIHPAPRKPAAPALEPFRADLTDGPAIVARMVRDMEEAPALAPHDAAIDRDFFLNLGWTRHQIAAFAPRAIEQFRRAA